MTPRLIHNVLFPSLSQAWAPAAGGALAGISLTPGPGIQPLPPPPRRAQHRRHTVSYTLELQTRVREGFHNHGEGPQQGPSAFTFTFKTLLFRHYAKQVNIKVDVKLGCQFKSPLERAGCKGLVL